MNASLTRTGPTTWRAQCGNDINDCIRDAISIAKTEGWHDPGWTSMNGRTSEFGPLNDVVEFDFNGVTVRVNRTSVATEIYKAWNYGMAGLLKVAGPGPAPDLDVELAEVKLERAKCEKERREAQRAKDAIIIAKVDAEIDGVALEYALGGEEEWAKCVAKNPDPYGAGTIRYAERWGRLMQARIRGGATVASVSNQASCDADAGFGMSGHTHGFAESMLRHWWAHGSKM